MGLFRFTSDKKLIEELRRSKLDLHWLEYQIENSSGQPFAVYSEQWKKEKKYHDQVENELEKRGLVQK